MFLTFFKEKALKTVCVLGFYDIFYSCCLALLSKWLLPNFPTSRTPQKPIIRTKWVHLIVRFCVCKLSNRIFEQYLKTLVSTKTFEIVL